MQAKCHRVVFLIQIYGGEDTKPAYTSCPKNGEEMGVEGGLEGILKRTPRPPPRKKKEKRKRNFKKKERGREGERQREKSNRNQVILLLKWQPREELKGNGYVIKA